MVAKDSRPVVWVLMATFNGAPYLTQQVDSILSQRDVDVRLLVSDDGSTDQTIPILRRYAKRDDRVQILPPRSGPPGVAGNFFRLLEHCCADQRLADTDFVAFSDQDDIWKLDKLAVEVNALQRLEADVVSTNVLAFDYQGRVKLIRKDHPQRRWDFIFEAAGPGCTYVFPAAIARLFSAFIREQDVGQISVHDWYLYVLARSRGLRWVILSRPTVRYRQHGRNVQGANRGFWAAFKRIRDLHSGFYREQFLLNIDAALTFAGPSRNQRWTSGLKRMQRMLSQPTFAHRLHFLALSRHIRRRPCQGLAMALGFLFYVW